MSEPDLFEHFAAAEVVSSRGKHTPYAHYADSGSKWLGRLPAHWKTRKLKFIATSRPSNVDKKSVEGEKPVRLCNYVDVYKNDYITPDLDFMVATADDAQVAKFRLRYGDVLITKDSEEWSDIAVPAFVTQDFDDVVCGYHLSQVRPRAGSVDGEYLFRAFTAGGIAQQFQVLANGVTRFGLSTGAIDGVEFPVPPLAEQRQIAAFLDRETSRIDRLIADNTHLIGLLDERLSGFIERAVTNGGAFDRSANASAVPALAKPAWPTLPFRRFITGLEQGWSPEAEQRLAGHDEWAVLKVGAVFRGDFRVSEHKALPASLEPESRFEVRPGDLLMTRGNTPELVADVCVVPDSVRPRLMLSDLHYRIRLDERRLLKSFASLWFLSRSGRSQIEADARGTSNSMVKVSQSHIRRWHVSVPPLDEQARIVGAVTEERERVGLLKARVAEAIDRLREYRSSLITAAVTGDIDVRHQAGGPT